MVLYSYFRNEIKRIKNRSFLNRIKQYGPVIKFQFLNRMVVATVDADAVREILITKFFPKEPIVINIVAYPFSER